jgi:hypothetical protein
VRLPKQAKPAFLVEAPNGTAFRSHNQNRFFRMFFFNGNSCPESGKSGTNNDNFSFSVEGFSSQMLFMRDR